MDESEKVSCPKTGPKQNIGDYCYVDLSVKTPDKSIHFIAQNKDK